jgi:hypothetical protein
VVATHIDTGEQLSFDSASEAARQLGLSQANINSHLNGNGTRVGRYKFGLDPAYAAEQANLPGEEWKSVPEDRVAYGIEKGLLKTIKVSNMGRIQNMKGRMSYGTRRTSADPESYMKLAIEFNGKLSHLYVHVFCTLAFVGARPSPDQSVDHIDRKKNNNRSDNLRWCTAEEQSQNLDQNRAIHKIDRETGHIICTFSTVAEAARENNLTSNGAIIMAATGIRDHSCGFAWKYAT